MNNLLVGLLSALVSTNAPVALSNLVTRTTGITLQLSDPNDPLESPVEIQASPKGKKTQRIHLLSGGERARLMLAKLFAEPGNMIVLDEPTNDLDMDTLDLLQEVLSDFEGTLLLVSHDRDFLDRLVTSTIAVEGNGEVVEYAGGYSDYVIQRGERTERIQPRKPEAKRTEAPKPNAPAPARFSMKEQRELDEINVRLDRLHTEISTLESGLAYPALYQRDAAKAAQAGVLLARKRDELHATEERWLELEEKRTQLSGAR